MTEALTRRTDTADLGPLADSLGLLLRLSQLKSFGEFFDALAEIDMRPGELSALILISHNPGIRQGKVARTLKIKRAHMAKMAAAMEREGLVTRTAPADDGRALELRLTEAGRARVATLMPVFEAYEARQPDTLTRAEEATLKRLLRKYVALPDPEEAK